MKQILTGIMFCCLAITGNANAQQPLPVNPEDARPLMIGDMVPTAVISNTNGEMINIQKLTAGKKTALVFYRGGWCPYCNKHLSELAMIEKDLTALGYQIIAVSPDKPEALRNTGTKIKQGYQLYSDGKGELIRAMGIAYQAPAHYAGVIREASGGVNQELLPVPSVFLLDVKGAIRFSYVNPDFKQRISGDQLLAAAKELH